MLVYRLVDVTPELRRLEVSCRGQSLCFQRLNHAEVRQLVNAPSFLAAVSVESSVRWVPCSFCAHEMIAHDSESLIFRPQPGQCARRCSEKWNETRMLLVRDPLLNE